MAIAAAVVAAVVAAAVAAVAAGLDEVQQLASKQVALPFIKMSHHT